MTEWFARTIFRVTGVEASLRFYIDRCGFTNPWSYTEDGKVRVAQVEREGCVIVLADNLPDKTGNGLLFVSLHIQPHSLEAESAALDGLRAELEAKGVPVKDGSWGYRLLIVEDPDGNQLFFNYSNDPAPDIAVLLKV